MAKKHRRRRQNRRRGGQTPLRMTSMMDILTVLLLFLLKSFVVEGEVITPVPGVVLPESTSDTSPDASVVVAIFDDTIMLDGEVVGRVSAAVAGSELLIPTLADRLGRSLEQSRAIAAQRGDEADITPKVAIQGDQDISFDILQRVMYTCNHSGYGDIALAVIGAS